MEEATLYVSDVAKIVGVHRSSILRFERMGLIKSKRDRSNYRRYSLKDALELKKRIPSRRETLELIESSGLAAESG